MAAEGPPPELQPIGPEHADAFKDVRLRALRDAPSAFGSTYQKESAFNDAEWMERAARLAGPGAIGYLAIDEETPCGIAAGFIDREDTTRATLVSMWVAPTHRRSGVGRLLVDAILAWAGSRSVETLRLTVTSRNQAAMRFYESLGFERTGVTAPYPNDPREHEVEMARRVR